MMLSRQMRSVGGGGWDRNPIYVAHVFSGWTPGITSSQRRVGVRVTA